MQHYYRITEKCKNWHRS